MCRSVAASGRAGGGCDSVSCSGRGAGLMGRLRRQTLSAATPTHGALQQLRGMHADLRLLNTYFIGLLQIIRDSVLDKSTGTEG